MDIKVLKRLYLASLGMVESEPDMLSHESTEAEFVRAMKEAQSELKAAGIDVPELSEF